MLGGAGLPLCARQTPNIRQLSLSPGDSWQHTPSHIIHRGDRKGIINCCWFSGGILGGAFILAFMSSGNIHYLSIVDILKSNAVCLHINVEIFAVSAIADCSWKLEWEYDHDSSS